MWGTKANTSSVKEYAVGSMKWHLVDESSLEKITIKIGFFNILEAERTYGFLDCGRKGREPFPNEEKIPLVFKDKIKLHQSNVCTHCKKARMRELELDQVDI